MELEVSKKVREAIKAKLLELGCHVDDELPDYIMILIANRRTNVEIESDLSLFLTDSTKKFVSWLTHVLKKLEEVTATTGAPKPPVATTSVAPAEDAPGPSSGNKDKAKSSSKDKKKSKDKTDKKLKRKRSKEDVKVQIAKDVFIEVKDRRKGSTTDKLDRRRESSPSSSQQKDGESSTREIEKSKPEEVELPLVVPAEESPKKRKIVLKKSHLDTLTASPRKDYNAKPSSTGEDDAASKPVKEVDESKPEETAATDTLILHTEDNEFSENLEELRRIALESQQEKRRKSQEEQQSQNGGKEKDHQRKLITNILMSQNKSSTTRPGASSSSRDLRSSLRSGNNRVERSREERSPSPRRNRTSTSSSSHRDRLSDVSPSKRSIFSRIGRKDRHSRSRSPVNRRASRSRSPPSANKKLTSTIGTVIQRLSLEDYESDDEEPVVQKMSSVIKVTERPKRDLRMSSKMLFMAVADAQQSIIQKGQSQSGLRESDRSSRRSHRDREESENHRETRSRSSRMVGRKRNSDETDEDKKSDLRLVAKRRFNEFPEVISDDFNESTKSSVRRKSIKERLGVKRDRDIMQDKKSIKDRLGMVNKEESGADNEESMTGNYSDDYYNEKDDFNIVINVNDGNSYNMEKRNVTLASTDIDMSKRISIRVNNSEDDDTETSDSDDDGARETRDVRGKFKKGSKPRGKEMEGEIELSISDEDKLPDGPAHDSENEYIVEEIEVEEDDSPKGSEGSPENPPTEEKQENNAQMDAYDQLFAITLNPKVPPPQPIKPIITTLPDLRSRLGNSKALVVTKSSNLPITGGGSLKCKYWPKCQFKDTCVYEHPKCKFNQSCTNQECYYKHDGPKYQQKSDSLSSAAGQGNKKIVCKFYPKCTSMNCKFHHPSPCRFGLGCTDGKCENYHPGVTLGVQKLSAKGVTVIPKANQLKWVKSQQT